MPEQPIQQSQEYAYSADPSTRINELEEKQRLLKDRLLLIGENLISTKEGAETEFAELKQTNKELQQQVKQLQRQNQRIVYELQNLARKSEVEILQKQFKIFEPMEIARIKDIEEIVKKEIKELVKK